MFDLNAEVRRWRERRERQTSLSPRELDELEDHLRARVDLEMEIDRVLAPERAFAIARRELGKPAALEQEFAKAGKPRWRRWLVAGWAAFAASFVLPVVKGFPSEGWVRGWEAAILPLTGLAFWPPPSLWDLVPVLSSLTNLLMFATLLELRTPRPRRTRWLAALASGAAVLNLQWLLGWAEPVILPPLGMGIGYWAWAASFFCVAAALWMHVRELKPATPKPIGGSIA
ncbi:MAG: hypothetical protein F4Z50_00215 [Gemmatimonadetes bacterium]|nr:hypothetical protein [Gemmatimonadota bacterium]MYD13920.1 hypothetical protein [Gemmatimonadota bacterium]